MNTNTSFCTDRAEKYISHIAHVSLGTHQSLTKNSNVKVLQFFIYLWVDLKTIREVNWNDVDFTTILLLCWEIGEGLYLC